MAIRIENITKALNRWTNVESWRRFTQDLRQWHCWKRIQRDQCDDNEQELNLEFGLIKIAMMYIKNITSSPGTTKLQGADDSVKILFCMKFSFQRLLPNLISVDSIGCLPFYSCVFILVTKHLNWSEGGNNNVNMETVLSSSVSFLFKDLAAKNYLFRAEKQFSLRTNPSFQNSII